MVWGRGGGKRGKNEMEIRRKLKTLELIISDQLDEHIWQRKLRKMSITIWGNLRPWDKMEGNSILK